MHQMEFFFFLIFPRLEEAYEESGNTVRTAVGVVVISCNIFLGKLGA